MKTIATLLQQAEAIARERGADKPAAEHLVLAALQLPDGTASQALERLGSSSNDFRAALDAQETEDLERIGVHAPSDRISAERPEPSATTGVYDSEASAKQLFRAAGDDARRNEGSFVGAHMLRAAAALEHGPTARALRRMGIDRDALRGAAGDEIQGAPRA